MNNEVLQKSWSSIVPSLAQNYLAYYPKQTLHLLTNFMKEKDLYVVLELGCGNAHLFQYMVDEIGLNLYHGVEFSLPLYQEAYNKYHIYNDDGTFEVFNCDLYDFEPSRKYDIVLISHLMELISSPDLLLEKYKNTSQYLAIRWYEPPIHEHDIMELLPSAHPSSEENAPYLRRKMSKDYFQHLLDKHGLKIEKEEVGAHANDLLTILKNKNNE